MLPRGHVFLAGFGAAELDEITIYSDGIIVEKSRVTVVPVSLFDLHNASKTVSIVDCPLHRLQVPAMFPPRSMVEQTACQSGQSAVLMQSAVTIAKNIPRNQAINVIA